MSNMKKAFEANARMGLKPLGEVKKMKKGGAVRMAEGGLVQKRMANIEQAAGGPVVPVAVAPVAPVAPAPAPAVGMSPEELSIRQKYGMATPGVSPPPPTGIVGTIKKKLGYKDGGEVSLRHALRAGKSGMVHGPGGGTDDEVPIMASNGEYVLPAKTVKHIGKDVLDDVVRETNEHEPNNTDMDDVSLRHAYALGGVIADDEIPKPRGGNIYTPEAKAYEAARGPVASGGGSPLPPAEPAVGSIRSGLNTLGKVARVGGAVIPAAIEGSRVASVVNDPNSSSGDVATQVATGVGRGAATVAGATYGAGLGSVVPGIGTAIGGALGGAAGYFLGDRAIKYGRKLATSLGFATDEADPAERVSLRTPQALSAAVAPPTNTGTLTGSSTMPAAAPVEAQPQTIRRPINADERARLYSIYGNPDRYNQANIDAEHAAVEAKYRIDKPGADRPYGDTAPGTFSDQMNIRAEEKRRALNAELGQRDTASLRTALGANARIAYDRENAAREQYNKDRQYGFDVAKTSAEFANKAEDNARADAAARDVAHKALTERISTMIPPTKDANGKPVADGDTAARYMTGINTMLGERIARTKAYVQQNPNDAAAKAWLARADKEGVKALDESDVRKFVAGMQAADVAQQNHSIVNPIGGTAVTSDAPVTSLRRRPGVIFDDYVTDRGDVIPARALDSQGGVLGALGQRNRNYDILKNK